MALMAEGWNACFWRPTWDRAHAFSRTALLNACVWRPTWDRAHAFSRTALLGLCASSVPSHSDSITKHTQQGLSRLSPSLEQPNLQGRLPCLGSSPSPVRNQRPHHQLWCIVCLREQSWDLVTSNKSYLAGGSPSFCPVFNQTYTILPLSSWNIWKRTTQFLVADPHVSRKTFLSSDLLAITLPFPSATFPDFPQGLGAKLALVLFALLVESRRQGHRRRK